MSTYLLVDKLAQDWTEMWTPLSHNASASRCNKQQIFPYFTVIVANLSVMSSIDFTNNKYENN